MHVIHEVIHIWMICLDSYDTKLMGCMNIDCLISLTLKIYIVNNLVVMSNYVSLSIEK